MMDQNFVEQFLLALGGFLFHFLKLWYAAVNRQERFLSAKLGIWSAMNILAAFLLVYIGASLPADLLVMSPITCVLIGFSGSSMLAGFINVKTTKSKGIHDSNAMFSNGEGEDQGDDTGGSNPPPDKPKPPTPPGGGPQPQ